MVFGRFAGNRREKYGRAGRRSIDISRILKSLPEELRKQRFYIFFKDRKQKDIAKLQESSLSLVKYRITTCARELLAKELKGGENREKK